MIFSQAFRKDSVLNNLRYQQAPRDAWDELMEMSGRIERKLALVEQALDARRSKHPIAVTEATFALAEAKLTGSALGSLSRLNTEPTSVTRAPTGRTSAAGRIRVRRRHRAGRRRLERRPAGRCARACANGRHPRA